MTAGPAQLWTSTLHAGNQVHTRFGKAVVQERRKLRLQLTDRMVVCDPHQMRGETGLAPRIRPGLWVVEAVVIRGRSKELRDRVAALRVYDEKWSSRNRIAEVSGWKSAGKLLVDSARGCVTHPRAVDRLFDSDRLRESFHDHIDSLTQITGFRGRGATVIAFETGFGDGAYELWWGHGDRDEPVALLADFGVLVERGTSTFTRVLNGLIKECRSFELVADRLRALEFADERGHLERKQAAELGRSKKRVARLSEKIDGLLRKLDAFPEESHRFYEQQRAASEADLARCWDALARGTEPPYSIYWVWAQARTEWLQ